MRAMAQLGCLLSLSMLTPGPTMAQPSVEDLRQRLDTLRANRPASVPEGTVRSIGYLIDTAERIENGFAEQSVAWRQHASTFLSRAAEGHDPYPEQRGRIVNRSHRTELSRLAQGYALYLPPDYDPARPWPLMIVLHGGSSNGNLFLGVVLGHNMSWEHYSEYLWNDFTPRWSPNVIVASPDGFGQVMWRWMGEQDVLDVIADIKRHYHVDDDRVILAGLSNGGVGAYSIGLRHASEFSMVQAIAGAPSWLQYAGGRPLPEERIAMEMFSGMHLIENSVNTDFRFYHGHEDTGPMRPRYVQQLEAKMGELGLEPNATWYDAGHDILYRVHRHGRTFDRLAEVARNRSPQEVRVVTGDYRASRQHWVTVTRIDQYPELARVQAGVTEEGVGVQTANVNAFSLDVRDVPWPEGTEVRITVDDAEVFRGPRAHLGHVVHFVRNGGAFRLGFPEEPAGMLVKRPGISGPLTDAYYGPMVHVYGTGDETHTEALRAAAERGARGWPVWLWRYRHEVVADSDVTESLMRTAHLVLYGTASDNAILARLWGRLPIRVEEDAVVVGRRRYVGDDVGVRYIYPNPESPERYVIVQGGVSTQAVRAGHNLPDFLPDYLVYDGTTTRNRQRLATGRNRPLLLGYFDGHWALPPPDPQAAGEGGDPTGPDDGETAMPVPPAPPAPAPPRRFGAPADDPAGENARRIARLVRGFRNYRAEIPGATWRVDPDASWTIGPQGDCHAALEAAGVPFRPLAAHPTPVPSPVELLGPVGGVWFRMMHGDRPLSLSCELARKLPTIAAVLSRHGVLGVDIMSAYRDRPRTSFHTLGLGLDLARFWTRTGWMSVLIDFEETPGHETCDGPVPNGRRASVLRRIACDLFETRELSSILTPNYNDGHRDHFHIDVRPDDPRLFLR